MSKDSPPARRAEKTLRHTCFVATKYCGIERPTDLVAYSTLALRQFGLSFTDWLERSELHRSTLKTVIKRLSALNLINKTDSALWTAKEPQAGWFVPRKNPKTTLWSKRILYFAWEWDFRSFTLTDNLLIYRLYNLAGSGRFTCSVSGLAANVRVSTKTVSRSMVVLDGSNKINFSCTLNRGQRGKRQRGSVVVHHVGRLVNPDQPSPAPLPSAPPGTPTEQDQPTVNAPATASQPAPGNATPPAPLPVTPKSPDDDREPKVDCVSCGKFSLDLTNGCCQDCWQEYEREKHELIARPPLVLRALPAHPEVPPASLAAKGVSVDEYSDDVDKLEEDYQRFLQDLADLD